MSCLHTCPTMPRGLSGRFRSDVQPTTWPTMWSPRSEPPSRPGTFWAWPLACVTPPLPQVYAVATSTNTPCSRIPRMTGEEKEFETIERGRRRPELGLLLGLPSPPGPLTTAPISADDRYIHPQQEAFSIQLISPVSWEAIPNAR